MSDFRGIPYYRLQPMCIEVQINAELFTGPINFSNSVICDRINDGVFDSISLTLFVRLDLIGSLTMSPPTATISMNEASNAAFLR